MPPKSPALLDEVYAEIEPTISREASYWSVKFPRGEGVTRAVLYQEGWIIAARVLQHFDCGRAKLTTFLTLALRNRFRTLLMQTFRAYHHRGIVGALERRRYSGRPYWPTDSTLPNNAAVRGEQEGLALLSSLSNDERRVAGWLMDCNGSAAVVARRYGVKVTTVNRFRRSIKAKLT